LQSQYQPLPSPFLAAALPRVPPQGSSFGYLHSDDTTTSTQHDGPETLHTMPSLSLPTAAAAVTHTYASAIHGSTRASRDRSK
jgi:hypothetical protein